MISRRSFPARGNGTDRIPGDMRNKPWLLPSSSSAGSFHCACTNSLMLWWLTMGVIPLSAKKVIWPSIPWNIRIRYFQLSSLYCFFSWGASVCLVELYISNDGVFGTATGWVPCRLPDHCRICCSPSFSALFFAFHLLTIRVSGPEFLFCLCCKYQQCCSISFLCRPSMATTPSSHSSILPSACRWIVSAIWRSGLSCWRFGLSHL